MDKINRDLPNNIWNREGFAMCGLEEHQRKRLAAGKILMMRSMMR